MSHMLCGPLTCLYVGSSTRRSWLVILWLLWQGLAATSLWPTGLAVRRGHSERPFLPLFTNRVIQA